MSCLYISGGRQRKLLLRNEDEWNLYEAALILRLDTSSGAVETCAEYRTPPGARASANSSILFKSGFLTSAELYTCTSTEVIIFSLPDFHKVGYISLPCFNDLHHVRPLSDGTLAAADTGLDMVVRFSRLGELVSACSVLREAAWSRFSPNIDYRRVESTKPHKSHPNFVFELDGQVWVTRFRQRDAVCLSDRTKRIRIALEGPHDGVLHGNHIYFTTVDGKVVIVDQKSLQLDRVIELQEIDNKNAILGWCRGLLPIDERYVWVGFTRIRKTQFKENVLWVKNVVRPGMSEKPTHIALYDILKRKCLQEIDLEAHGLNIVFSIFPASGVAGFDAVSETETQKTTPTTKPRWLPVGDREKPEFSNDNRLPRRCP